MLETATEVLEGTWEQISRQSERLAGKWLRVEVSEPASDPEMLVVDGPSSRDARAQAILDWGYGHRPRNGPPLSDEAISRESIYSDDSD